MAQWARDVQRSRVATGDVTTYRKLVPNGNKHPGNTLFIAERAAWTVSLRSNFPIARMLSDFITSILLPAWRKAVSFVWLIHSVRMETETAACSSYHTPVMP